MTSLVLSLLLLLPAAARAVDGGGVGHVVEEGANERITSIYLSQTFLNEQLGAHLKTSFLKDVKLALDPKLNRIIMAGLLQVPVEELKAVNLDPKLGAFRFRVAIQAKATNKGYLILSFPLNETYFYPADTKGAYEDRIFVPVQMLSLAIASLRGYFAALSGDFSSLDREKVKYEALIRDLDRSIKHETNADALDALQTERASLKLKLQALPIERKQLTILGKEFGSMMQFAGEKDINLNDEFAARKNAVMLKLDLQKFTPYLKGVELGGIRILHDDHDGLKGENYFSVDINAHSSTNGGQIIGLKMPKPSDDQEGLDVAPSAMVRVNQALFESDMIVSAEKKSMGSMLTDLKMELTNDGVHVTGKYHKLIFTIPFDTTVDLDSSETSFDQFDIAVRSIKVLGIDLDFLTGYVLEAMKTRLDQTLKGMCSFEYIPSLKKDHSKALRVTMDPAKLIPALPDLHVVDVDVRDRVFIFKVGRK